MMTTNLKRSHSQLSQVFKLWEKLISLTSLPQLDHFLAQEFSKNKSFGSKDRKVYSELIFAGIRHGYFALFCHEIHTNKKNIDIFFDDFCKKYSDFSIFFQEIKKIPSVHFFSWVFLRYCENNQVTPEISSLFSEISQEKHAFFKNILNFADGLEQKSDENLKWKMLYFSIPPHYFKYLKHKIESKHCSFLNTYFNNLDSRPPLWIRLNHISKQKDVFEELTAQGFQWHEHDNGAIEVKGAKGIYNLKSFQNGFFEVQDFASQTLGLQMPWKPKQSIWDCCAGGGGKTMQLASFLQNKGVIYASDIREYKLEEIKKRARRAGFFNIRCMPWDGQTFPKFPIEVTKNSGFNGVFVDAPCSSSGTWRRNPDAKYRFKIENLSDLNCLQVSLLSKASEMVAAGGHLVYATCSWFVEENEQVVRNFLQNNSSFEFVSELNPGFDDSTDSDSMYVAVLRKV